MSEHLLSEDIARALGLTLQILEELPEEWRPESNREDMRGLLGGQSSGRDGMIITEAVAMALAYRTQRMIANPVYIKSDDKDEQERWIKIINNRVQEVAELFGLVGRIDTYTLAHYYQEACIRLGSAVQGDHGRR